MEGFAAVFVGLIRSLHLWFFLHTMPFYKYSLIHPTPSDWIQLYQTDATIQRHS